jgi:adenylate cyclase
VQRRLPRRVEKRQRLARLDDVAVAYYWRSRSASLAVAEPGSWLAGIGENPATMSPPASRQRLLAILAADAVGYSRLMAADDRGTLDALDAAREVFGALISAQHGRVVDMAGDSVLAVFDTATGAVTAALGAQRQLAARDAGQSDDHRLHFRIGIHLGDVLEKPDGTVYGNGVNVAARLEGLAEPGGIAVSESIRSATKGKVAVEFIDQGEQEVKNIPDLIRVWQLRDLEGTAPLGSAALARSEVRSPVPAVARSEKPSIAVLPFANVSGDPEQNYFVDGITEDLTTDLARMQWLFVIASSSTQHYRSVAVDVKQVGRELGVRYLLDGSVRRHQDRLRINARLLDARSGAQLWAERYDRDVADVFALQDEIGRLICASVGLSVPDAELARVRQKHPRSLTAWDRYLLALAAHRESSKEGFQRAVTLLSEAIALEPDFATAHARLAHAYVRAAHFGWAGSGASAIAQARDHARTALALDPQSALALDAMASVHSYLGEVDAAAAAARSALAIDPSISAAYGTLANALAFAGKADEAITVYEACRQLSPRDPDRSSALMGFCNALFVAARYDEAVVAARQHQVLRPNWYGSQALLAVCNAQLGRLEDARKAATELVRQVPHFSLDGARRRSFFKRPEDVMRMIDGLRLAGIPEYAARPPGESLSRKRP